MSKLRIASSEKWLEAVLGDFDHFLLDHASCERKASATALSFISHYPDRRLLVQDMMLLAREELEHFHQMLFLLQSRDLVLERDEKDPYIQGLRKEFRDGREDYFLDRLLVGSIVEARGCERFGMLAEALKDAALRQFYWEIARSESRHQALFYRQARNYFAADEVDRRQDELLEREAEILQATPIRAVVH